MCDFFNPIYQSSYDAHIFHQEEPQLITHGNGKRYKPIVNGIGEHQRGKDAFIEKYGQQEWDKRCREDSKKQDFNNE